MIVEMAMARAVERIGNEEAGVPEGYGAAFLKALRDAIERLEPLFAEFD